MALKITLAPVHPSSFCDEAVEIRVGIRPEGPDDTLLPPDAWQRVRVEVEAPSAERFYLAPFDADPPLPEDYWVLAGAEVERCFSLRPRLPRGAEGRFALRATLWDGERVADQAACSAWVHGALATLAAAAAPCDPEGVAPARLWSLHLAAEEAAVRSRALLAAGEDPREPWHLGLPSRTAVFPGGARGLVASREALSDPLHASRWVAWWDEAFVGVAIATSTPVSTVFELEGGVTRALPRALPRADGGCELVVVSADARELTWLRLAAPAPNTEAESTLVDVGSLAATALSAEASAGDVDDEDDEPPLALPPPEALRRDRIGWAVTHGACARRADTAGLGVVLARDHLDGVEVTLSLFDEDGVAGPRAVQRVEGARLIPGADPCLDFDAAGRARITLLHVDAGGAQLARTRLAFGADGTPLLLGGVGTRALAPLSSACVEGAVVDLDATEAWLDAWAVRTADGAILSGVGDRVGPPTPAPAGLVRPLCLVADRWSAALAVAEADGALRLARLL